MNDFFERTGSILAALIALLILAACAAAGDGQATPTPVSAIRNLPLPTVSPAEVVVAAVTPTPPAEGEQVEQTAEPAGEATEQPAGDTATAEPAGEAVGQPAAEGTAEPTGEATEQPAADETGTVEPAAEVETAEETAGPAAATSPPSNGDPVAAVNEAELIDQGQALYTTHCAPCHQSNGEGIFSAVPALNGNALLTEDLLPAVYIVLHGREEMPSFDRALSDRQIAAILSYARNAWDNQASLVSVEQVRGVQETGIIEMAQVE